MAGAWSEAAAACFGADPCRRQQLQQLKVDVATGLRQSPTWSAHGFQPSSWQLTQLLKVRQPIVRGV